MSARTDVLLWAQRVVGREGAAAHLRLEIAASDGLDVAQAAFHKIARMAHPDLHRTTLSAEELELVTRAYALTAAAYQEIRLRCLGTATGRMRAVRPPGPGSDPAITPPGTAPPGTTRAGAAGSRPPGSAAGAHAGQATAAQAVRPPDTAADQPATSGTGAAAAPPPMTAKALLYYRKAELCLRRGDLTDAVLQLKMAIASDPQSTFLRTALTQVQAELRKKP